MMRLTERAKRHVMEVFHKNEVEYLQETYNILINFKGTYDKFGNYTIQVTQKELAQKLNVHTSTVRRRLNKLWYYGIIDVNSSKKPNRIQIWNLILPPTEVKDERGEVRYAGYNSLICNWEREKLNKQERK